MPLHLLMISIANGRLVGAESIWTYWINAVIKQLTEAQGPVQEWEDCRISPQEK